MIVIRSALVSLYVFLGSVSETTHSSFMAVFQGEPGLLILMHN